MAQTKSKKIFRYALYSLLGAGVLGVVVFGSSHMPYSNYASAQSDNSTSQALAVQETIDQPSPELKNPYKTKNSPWIKLLYVILSLATAIVLVKVIRHPK